MSSDFENFIDELNDLLDKYAVNLSGDDGGSIFLSRDNYAHRFKVVCEGPKWATIGEQQ